MAPFALSGTSRSFPIHRHTMEPAPVRLAIGPAVEVGAGVGDTGAGDDGAGDDGLPGQAASSRATDEAARRRMRRA